MTTGPAPVPAATDTLINRNLAAIREDVIAIGHDQHDRLGRIEQELATIRQQLNAICNTIGGSLKNWRPPRA